MTWAALFERAEDYEVSVEEVRRALRERRGELAGDDETEDDV